MSSIAKAVMLDALGWSRDGKKYNHLPDDIVNIIHNFVFFDVRTEAYREHLLRKNIKSDKLNALNHMMLLIDDGWTRYASGYYGMDNTFVNIGNNFCTICGEFVSILIPLIPENIRCNCEFNFLSDDEIMDLEYERQDNYFWEEEEDIERDHERRRKNRELDAKCGDSDCITYAIEDDPYSDRKPNWDECCNSCENYDYCDDNNSYF